MIRSRQKGAVMIAALIITVLVVSLSVGLAVAHQRTQLSAESRFHGNQAREYLLGAEQLAAYVLEQDYQSDEEDNEFIDSTDEPWAQGITFPLDEGFMQGQLVDAQARFDLNRLATQVTQQNLASNDPARFTEDQRRFIRLLQALDDENPMTESDAIATLEAIVDWIDADDNTFGFGGAESLFYQRFDPPVKIANRPLTSTTELLLIKGMTRELYLALTPYVTALPSGTGLNLNTAESKVLRTINISTTLAPLPEIDADDIIVERGATGYTDVASFLSGAVPTALAAAGTLDTDGLVVASDYFISTATVQVSRQRRTMLSLMHRNSGVVKPLRHSDFVL